MHSLISQARAVRRKKRAMKWARIMPASLLVNNKPVNGLHFGRSY